MKIFWIFICLLCVATAKKPGDPYFSMKDKQLHEPPALPQIYGLELPDSLGYFLMPPTPSNYNAFLPQEPLILEICAITGQPMYFYPTKESLLQGCYEGDMGLSFFELRPHEYWQALGKLEGVGLVPQEPVTTNIIRIVANYKQPVSGRVLTSVEIGDTNYPATLISINGQSFMNHPEVMSAFYGLIMKLEEDAYPRETRALIY